MRMRIKVRIARGHKSLEAASASVSNTDPTIRFRCSLGCAEAKSLPFKVKVFVEGLLKLQLQ